MVASVLMPLVPTASSRMSEEETEDVAPPMTLPLPVVRISTPLPARVPLTCIAPEAERMLALVSSKTPSLFALAPPMPVMVMLPLELCTMPLLAIRMPWALVVDARPVPLRIMLPVPDCSWAPLINMPSTREPCPMAGVVDGEVPPPRVMLPPFELSSVPVLSCIAPPLTVAWSRSEFSTMV